MWIGLLLMLAQAAPGESERVFSAAGPSVVALRCPDGHGSGLILSADGLILTNAHVMISAQAYTVDVDHPSRVTYRSAKLVGVHPKLDLALVRIDPKEHPIALRPITVAKDLPGTGEPVFAIGFPSSRGGWQKTITAGEVKTVNQFIEGHRYFEVSNEVWKGNSGGPLVNHRGELCGVITLRLTDGLDYYGAAIPIDEYRPEVFVPLRGRPPNPAAAHLYLQAAERFLKGAQDVDMRYGGYAEYLFVMALMHDISNPDVYFKIGLIRRNMGKPKAAIGYLIRSLLLDPTPAGGAVHYHELGAAFNLTGKKAEARAVWQEGLVKYPDDGVLWDAMAVDHYDEGRYVDAAVASRASIRKFGPRGEHMNKIYEQCLKRLSPEQKLELRVREESLNEHLASLKAEAAEARKRGKAFVLEACEKAIRDGEGLQFGEGLAAGAPANRPSLAGDAASVPDDELARLFVQAQYSIGREHLRSGRFDQAEEVFKEIVEKHPKAPEAEDARRYLQVLKDRKKK